MLCLTEMTKKQKIKLTVVDQSPVRKGGTSSDALRESVELATCVEKIGYSRYWVAEHHNSSSFSGTSPEILIGQIAAKTKHIRVGSGGVMLSHYSALKVAEQFSDFIIQKDEEVLDAVKARARDYSTLSLIKLLYQLRGNSMTFSDLYVKSKIRMKKSFLNYLHLCLNYKFITKKSIGPNVFYSITENGMTMLNLFMQKHD